MVNFLDYKLILSNRKQLNTILESEINNKKYLIKAFKFIDQTSSVKLKEV